MSKGLTADVLALTALEIVDAEGLSGLSMRRLSSQLGVDPMAAYRHVPSKEALLDSVVDAVLAKVVLPPRAAGSTPHDHLRAVVHAILEAVTAHPRAAPLLADRTWTTPAGLALTETILELAEGMGAPADVALAVNATGLLLVALGLAVHGATTREPAAVLAGLDPRTHPRLVAAVRGGTAVVSYEAVLDLWLDAVLREVERRATGSH